MTKSRKPAPARGSKPGERRGGRAKGTPNKATRDVREAIAHMLQQSADQMAEWLQSVAANDPAKALDLALKAAEYHIPKLARTELAGDPERPLFKVPDEQIEARIAELLARKS